MVAVNGQPGQALPHDSAKGHVTGQARYTDDLPEPGGLLHVAVGVSDCAHAKVHAIDLRAVLSSPGVVEVVTAADVPGKNDFGAIVDGDPVFASGHVEYYGQVLFAVAAETVDLARSAARKAEIVYEEAEPVLEIAEARKQELKVAPTEVLERGSPDDAIASASQRIAGRMRVGGQDHFYLEGQIAIAIPQEGEDQRIVSSTQHPGEVQHAVATVLGLSDKDIVVECRRMGGGFGGKESQPAQIACIAAIVANKTGRPAKLRLDRDIDMIVTGKRHDFDIDYKVGFDNDGGISGLDLSLSSRCGMSADLSAAINDRAMFHADNAYFVESVRVTSHRCKTNTVSNTAFRGFGGPQGMFAIENVIDDVARTLGKDPLDVRHRNIYGIANRNTTPYGQTVTDNILSDIIGQLVRTSDYRSRRSEIRDWNTQNKFLKRGIALTPVKFGISFTATHLNQAGALLHIYSDGSIQLNHGGTEMGQGLFTKVAQVVANELQVDIERIKITASDTSKVPNASATAASSGTDLNGKAAQRAATTLRERLTRFAAMHYNVSEKRVGFHNNNVRIGSRQVSFDELVRVAYMNRISLSATGFYRTPDIHFDRGTFEGRPFYYFAYGAAASEALIDTLTGENRILRVDILHDCGRSLNPAIDRGQIEGGFIQGMGWLTTEELWWSEVGELKTHAPSTYKIPTSSDTPVDFRVEMYESGGNREDTIYRSKAVGEPPLMLALSAYHAIKDAVASCSPVSQPIPLDAPATPESVLSAIGRLKQ